MAPRQTDSPAPPPGAHAAAITGSLRRDTGSVTAATLVVTGANFAYTLVLTWLLPAHDYSVFAAAQALLLTAANIASASLPWVAAHWISRDSSSDEARTNALSFVVLAAAAECLLGTLVIVGIAQRFSPALVLVALVTDSVLVFSMAPAVGYLQGYGRFGLLARLRVFNVVVKVVSGLLLVVLGAGAWGAVLSYSCGDLPLLVIGGALIAKEVRLSLHVLRSAVLWIQTLGFAGIQAVVAVLAGIDIVVATLLWQGPPAALASFQVAVLLSRVPFFLSSSLGQTVFQKLSTRSGNAPAIMAMSADVVLLVFVPAAFMVALAPQSLIRIIFPSSYSGLGVVLPLTATSGLLLGVINLMTTYFQAEGRYVRCLVPLSAALLDPLALAVGFRVDGLVGLAAGSVVGLGVVMLALLLVTVRTWSITYVITRRMAGAWLLAVPVIFLRPLELLWLAYAGALFIGLGWIAFWREGGIRG